MKVGVMGKGKWMLIVPALVIGMLSAAGQDKKTTSAAADPPSKAVQPAQPTTTVEKPVIDVKTYVIGENDLLTIDVWKEKEISQQIPVRPDGKISLPLIGEIQASGLTPLQLQDDITRKLKAYIENPEVTVIVDDPRSHQFNIVGQIARPGTYPLSESMTVLDAIAESGGFKDFAKETKIYVLRPMPGGIRVRIPFDYKAVIRGRDLQENVVLKPGDTVVVP
ncbi:MAG: polysaccharide biosynthesis/export family protein [Candidatus Acidiferrales bacterium]